MKNLVVMAAVVLAVSAVAGSATATDAKVIPGANCFEEGTGSGSAWYRTLTGYNSASSGTVSVICPLLRDDTQNTNGLAGLQMRVFALRGFPSTISCTAYSMRPTSTSEVRSVVRSAALSGNTIATLDWGTSMNLSVVDGYYLLNCTFPAGSGVASIRIDEN